jgi:hypothetical protein
MALVSAAPRRPDWYFSPTLRSYPSNARVAEGAAVETELLDLFALSMS